MFVNEIEPEPAVLMLYLNVRLSCFKLSILVDLYVILILSQKNACAHLTFPMPTIMIKSVPNNVISLYFFCSFLPVRSLSRFMQREVKLCCFFFALRDRFRTTVNVLGDSIVAGVVEHLSRDDLKNFDDYNGVMNDIAPLSNRDESRELDEIASTTIL